MEDVFIAFGSDFPIDEITSIAQAIDEAKIFVPGYVPPAVGSLNLHGFIFAQAHDGYEFVVLPDRNLVSRMARVQQNGVPATPDETTRNAINVLAFAKAMNFLIEPSIAFHELAQHSGNEIACEELRWFRIADNHDTWEWIEAAIGKRRDFSSHVPRSIETDHDLSFPLHRWRRNYIVALKIAELELLSLPPIDKSLRLLDWLFQDFLLAGPATVFATFYFSTASSRKRLLKHLRSPDRERAISGVKNAAWDITHLSDFLRHIEEGERERKRYIFATSDKGLARIAPLLLKDPQDGSIDGLANALEDWWSQQDAKRIVDTLVDYMDCAGLTSRRINQPAPSNFIDALIEEGEAKLRTSKL